MSDRTARHAPRLLIGVPAVDLSANNDVPVTTALHADLLAVSPSQTRRVRIGSLGRRSQTAEPPRRKESPTGLNVVLVETLARAGVARVGGVIGP